MFSLTVPMRYFFVDPFLLFMFRVCHVVLSVHCSLVVTCWERDNLLALLYVMFSFVFGTFSCVVLAQVWYLIVSNPDLCLLPYFKKLWDTWKKSLKMPSAMVDCCINLLILSANVRVDTNSDYPMWSTRFDHEAFKILHQTK